MQTTNGLDNTTPVNLKLIQPRSQGLSSGGKMRDPGNKVEIDHDCYF